jgi:hypothetical protein
VRCGDGGTVFIRHHACQLLRFGDGIWTREHLIQRVG